MRTLSSDINELAGACWWQKRSWKEKRDDTQRRKSGGKQFNNVKGQISHQPAHHRPARVTTSNQQGSPPASRLMVNQEEKSQEREEEKELKEEERKGFHLRWSDTLRSLVPFLVLFFFNQAQEMGLIPNASLPSRKELLRVRSTLTIHMTYNLVNDSNWFNTICSIR